jgi:hypothetical protein
MRRIAADATGGRPSGTAAGDRSDHGNPCQVTLLLPAKVVVNSHIE